MFDAELLGEKAFLVVAQRPFEYETEYGVVNLFSTLHPFLLEDGTPATPGDFPANGMVWWMVRPAVRGFAEPGRLLYATLEEARESSMPGKAWYQAQIDGIEPARPAKIVEILDAPPTGSPNPARSSAPTGRSGSTIRRWRRSTCSGRATSTARCRPRPPIPAAATGRSLFKPDNVDRQVNKIPESALEKVPADRRHELKVKVSLDDRPVLENPEHTCTYHLIMAGDFARWVEKEGTQLVLEGYDSLIRRHAKTFFSRKKSQDFIKLLDELADRVNGSPEPSDGDAAQVVKALGVRLAEIDAAGDELARSLLASGVLEPRLGPLLEQAERDHVERNTARLQAEIDLRVVRLRSELESLERQRNERRQKLEHEIQEGRREIERVQARQRQEFERECEAERERLGTRNRSWTASATC